ncbi:COP9 signalosome, subunit CSN2 [Reticulomyxa filosa]|uniref:COP9 signalosome, subunit CSN2 n=1 Tax=Reticulomyxa filosa TaxID=46433 RepID=X6NN61_RETFI|nr:COP9 signalosome, subunit CSN2 [Reticulomyxa filosa]|eukprot:ETO27406.1 COP9 signalosome, subunit CSN2 [Reticulomyxa filosa]
MEEVENLVVNSILDGSVYGRINQINSLLDLDFVTETDKLHNAMDGWVRTVKTLQASISQRSGQNELGYRGMGMGMGMGMGIDFDDDPFVSMGDDFEVFSFV